MTIMTFLIFSIHPNELSWYLLGSHHFLTVTSHLNDEGVDDPKARFYDSLTGANNLLIQGLFQAK